MVILVLDFLSSYAIEIIALSALFVAVSQTFIQRRHNKLSVRPHLTTFINYETNNPQPDAQGNIPPRIKKLIATLYNNGLGPAKIKKYCFKFDGIEIVDDKKDLKSTLNKIFGEGNYILHTSSNLKDDFALQTNQNLVIASVSFPLEGDQDEHPKEEELEKFGLKIKYQSFYGEKFTLDTSTTDNK